ncbi:MAG: ABC transporter ATP-binding protein [Caldilineae bacterium]|nr:ABC transporter ATP-binding protein [Chloroflexota bacterium]MCB9176403.1 ABC transporter ATP-binding protein [Caldilineae bacterium]
MSETLAEPLIRAQHVVKDFPLGIRKVRALADGDLDVYPGELVMVMGPSGSGKSTLLNLIGGLDRPSAGEILVDGRDIAHLDENALASFRREMIGFIFQSFNLVPTMTARQNVEFPMVFGGMPPAERRERAAVLLRQVGLGHRIDHRPLELSGGEQQRVAIARAMANRPRVLLCDEPTGNLDTRTGEEVLRILGALNAEGHTLLVVTHDPRLAAYCHRVVHMQDGRMLREEPGGLRRPPVTQLRPARRSSPPSTAVPSPHTNHPADEGVSP